MKHRFTKLLAATALVMCGGLAVAQDDSPTITPVEFFPCTFNDGKGMNDLEKVIARFNDFMDENDQSGYQAWLVMPNFVSGDHADWDIGWLGGWPSGQAMGESLDIWMTKGVALQQAFDNVVDCGAHINYAVLTMKEPTGETPSLPVLTFSDCEIPRDANMDVGLGAVNEWIEYEASIGANSPHWVFFPAYGADVDADYDFKWVTGYPNYTALGKAWHSYGNEGGWQKAEQIFPGALDCDTARVYTLKPVRLREES